MHCRNVRVGKFNAIVCGTRGRKISPEDLKRVEEALEMTDSDKNMSKEQSELIAKFRTVRLRMQEWAQQADMYHLPILAREFDHLGKQLDGAIANQVRAFRDEALKP